MYVVNTKPHGLIIMNDQKKIKNNSSYIFPYLFPWSFRAFGKCTLFLGCNSLPMETTTLHLSFLILGSLALVVGDALNKPSFVTCFLMCFLFQSFWRCYDELWSPRPFLALDPFFKIQIFLLLLLLFNELQTSHLGCCSQPPF